MSLTGYTMELESLINRHTVLIVVYIVLMLLMLFLAWFLPYLESGKKRHKPKTKRKAELGKKTKIKILVAQIVFSVLVLIVGILPVKNNVITLNALKKDASQNSVVVYEGDAYMHSTVDVRAGAIFNFLDLIVNYRLVTFESSDETYWIDMSKIFEGWNEYSGVFNGRIVYGENSKIILKIV